VDLDNARVDKFLAELFIRARDCQEFSALHCHGVVEGDGVEVALFFLGEVLEELLVEALIEDEKRYFLTIEK
jgi:hypothetical protein